MTRGDGARIWGLNTLKPNPLSIFITPTMTTPTKCSVWLFLMWISPKKEQSLKKIIKSSLLFFLICVGLLIRFPSPHFCFPWCFTKGVSWFSGKILLERLRFTHEWLSTYQNTDQPLCPSSGSLLRINPGSMNSPVLRESTFLLSRSFGDLIYLVLLNCM